MFYFLLLELVLAAFILRIVNVRRKDHITTDVVQYTTSSSSDACEAIQQTDVEYYHSAKCH